MGEKCGATGALREAAAYLLGAVAVTTQKVREVVRELVEKGELTREQGEKIVGTIEAKLTETAQGAGRRGRDGVDKLLGAMGLARKGTVDDLAQRIDALEKQMSPESCRGGEVES